MKLHDPISFPDSHGKRTEENLIYIANLAGWTLKEAWERNWEMADIEIEDGVAPPAETEAPKKRRGRPPGKSSKIPESAALLNAAEFVSVVQTDTFEMSNYATISGGQMVAYSNVMSAGFPVIEQLSLSPQLDKLIAALSRTGKTMAITEANGGLSIKGDKLRAVVPCLAEPLAAMTPDVPVINGDFDILKEAFKACSNVADEKSDRMMFASVLLDPNTVTATNGKVLLQYWHGIATLPAGTVLPKVFIQAVMATKYKITGLGGNFDPKAGFMRSFTIWFENGAWLKTQCYEERWQEFDHLFNVQLAAVVPVYEGLFDAIGAVEPFCDEGSSAIYFVDGAVQSHQNAETGAVYPVKDLPGGKIFHARLIKQVAPHIKQIDVQSSPDRAFFFGNAIRGIFMGMAGSQ